MVAGKDHDVLDAVAVDDIDVLGHCVSGATVPHIFGYTLGRGQDVQKLVAFSAEKVPAALTMADQGVRFVLGRNRHAANSRVHRV